MMRSKTRWTPAGLMAVALGAVAVFVAAQPAADEAPSVVSTVDDAVGDALFNAPAFQDVVFVQVTKTAAGDFELLMEMAGPVPVNPPLPPPGKSVIEWGWNFDLDPTTFPVGYPVHKGYASPEFVVHLSWDGAEFAGFAIDRRPLLTGGEAIITSVPFSIDGTMLQADLPYALIGAVPASFGWYGATLGWSGQVGSSDGFHAVDRAIFAP